MRILSLMLFTILLPLAVFPMKDGSELIAAMNKKYAGKWYRTMTFVQKTTTYKPDGTSELATWYEAMSVPGKLRIDIAPEEKGNGVIFDDGRMHSFRDGKQVASRELVHPLLVLGFDVYAQPSEKTAGQLRSLGIDLSVIRQDKWQGRAVYVVGAKAGDLSSPQFWVDKKNLYFVRLIETRETAEKKSIHETQFNKYERLKGGWVAPEVIFFVDGKRTMLEEYSDVQADIELAADLWDPAAWMTTSRDYYKPRK